MTHETTIAGYDADFTQLAQELGDLRYDALAVFLTALSKKIEDDGDKDQARNRVQLATQLHAGAEQLKQASQAIEKAWRICEPYM